MTPHIALAYFTWSEHHEKFIHLFHLSPSFRSRVKWNRSQPNKKDSGTRVNAIISFFPPSNTNIHQEDIRISSLAWNGDTSNTKKITSCSGELMTPWPAPRELSSPLTFEGCLGEIDQIVKCYQKCRSKPCPSNPTYPKHCVLSSIVVVAAPDSN